MGYATALGSQSQNILECVLGTARNEVDSNWHALGLLKDEIHSRDAQPRQRHNFYSHDRPHDHHPRRSIFNTLMRYTNVACGGTWGGHPAAPYAYKGGTVTSARVPTDRRGSATSQPGTTWPCPTAKTKFWQVSILVPSSRNASNWI